jgi:L-lactate dehydrogenase complex protein LldG
VPQDFTRWSDASIIDVTIVRSPLGVAETGSVLLSEEEFRVSTIGFLAHDIVILLDPAEIVEDIHDFCLPVQQGVPSMIIQAVTSKSCST